MTMMRFFLLHIWILLIPIAWLGETENKIQGKMAEVVEDQEENFVDANEDRLGIQEHQVSQNKYL